MAKITIRAVEAITPGETLWDGSVRGFGVRRQRGDPFYVLKYRLAGRQRWESIGRHGSPWTPETARREAMRRLGLIAAGQDPAEVAKAQAKAARTLAEVADAYLAAAKEKQRPRTHTEVRRYLIGAWQPLRATPLAEIKRDAVAAQLRALAAERGPVGAKHARAALSAMFNWAIGDGIADANPVAGTNQAAPRSRERVLSDAELAAVWRACGDDDYGRIVRLLILTGSRRDEVGGMAWTELDFERRLWTLPGARTKNGLPHEVPLTALMLRLIPERREGFVFGDGPRRNGDPHRGFSGWSKAKAQLDARLGADAPKGWTLHDLRRTAATRMADLGTAPHIIEAVLNHVSGARAGVAGIYNRALYASERREALARWSDHVAALAGA